MNIELIRAKARAHDYRLSAHAEEECEKDGIERSEIHTVLLTGDILEQYGERKDDRGDSCLMLGYDDDRRAIHVVMAYYQDTDLLIVTAYIPSLPKWLDDRTRRTQ